MENIPPQPSHRFIHPDRGRLRQALRTALATTMSLALARLCRLPEPFWAVITTVIVMQSTLGAAWDVSRQRLIGTFLGGIVAASIYAYFGDSTLAFAMGMFAMALVCAFFPLDQSAYRFAGVTLAVIMLPQLHESVWTVALHRFIEVAFGIIVGMAVFALWRE